MPQKLVFLGPAVELSDPEAIGRLGLSRALAVIQRRAGSPGARE
jgi:hypothetical protein